MTSAAIRFGDSPAETLPAETDTSLDEAVEAEPLFTVFVDEIDAWARQALAANGFGDPL